MEFVFDQPVRLSSPLVNAGGHAWTVELPQLPGGDDTDVTLPSCLVVSEDGKPLGPAHVPHHEIRQHGAGRYSHWQRGLWFSTSDNSDPNTNGRTYSVALSSARRAKQIEDIAAEAIEVVAIWSRHLPKDYDFAGKAVCEIGPGNTFGTVFVMVGLGADCMTIERTARAWDQETYPSLIEAICRTAPDLLKRAFYPERLQALIVRGAFGPQLRVFGGGLAAAGELGLSADLSVSASAFEHIDDVPAAMRALYAITKVGGLGVHWTDFRDHSNVERPLEFLLLSDEEHDRASDRVWRYHTGNRIGPSRYWDLIRDAGFECRFIGQMRVDPAYQADLVARLRRSGRWADQEMQFLNGVFRIARPAR